MKKLNDLEMSKIIGGRRLIGIFELGNGRSEWFYKNSDGSVYSVIR